MTLHKWLKKYGVWILIWKEIVSLSNNVLIFEKDFSSWSKKSLKISFPLIDITSHTYKCYKFCRFIGELVIKMNKESIIRIQTCIAFVKFNSIYLFSQDPSSDSRLLHWACVFLSDIRVSPSPCPSSRCGNHLQCLSSVTWRARCVDMCLWVLR